MGSHLLALKGEVVYSKQWRGEHLRESREGGRERDKCGDRKSPGMPGWQSRTALNKWASQELFFFLLILPDAFLYPHPTHPPPSLPPSACSLWPAPRNSTADCRFNDSPVRWLSRSFNVIFHSHVPYFNYDCHCETSCIFNSPIAPPLPQQCQL